MKKILKSKYFKIVHFEYTKEDIKKAIKDLKRFKEIFEEKLKEINGVEKND